MASRRNKAVRRYRKVAPASFYDYFLKEQGKPYVTLDDLRAQAEAEIRFFRTLTPNTDPAHSPAGKSEGSL